MALQALVKSLDDVVEKFRDEYKEIKEGESKGSFLLSVSATDGYSLAQVEKLQKALENERKDAKHQKYLVEQFGDVTPEQVKEMVTKVAEMDEWDPEKKLAEHKTKFETDALAKFEKEKVALVKKYTDELDALTKTSGSAEAELRKVLVQDALLSAVTELGGKPKLVPLIRDRVKLIIGDDGTRNVRVVDEKGEVVNSKAKDYMEPMTIGELVEEVRNDDDYAPLFEAKKASGSQGAPRVAADRNGNPQETPDKFNSVEAFKAARAGT